MRITVAAAALGAINANGRFGIMALTALHLIVNASQLILTKFMKPFGHFETAGGVTPVAFFAMGAIVYIIVTCGAAHLFKFVFAAPVTLVAGVFFVLAIDAKPSLTVVIKFHIFETSGCMAGFTLFAELTIMIVGVAAVARRIQPFVLT